MAMAGIVVEKATVALRQGVGRKVVRMAAWAVAGRKGGVVFDGSVDLEKKAWAWVPVDLRLDHKRKDGVVVVVVVEVKRMDVDAVVVVVVVVVDDDAVVGLAVAVTVPVADEGFG